MPKSIGCGELGESRPRTVGIRHSANASARFASLSLVKIKVTGQMQRLLVAAAVSLASASEPFSWADAQNAMHACTNGSRPLVDKYAYLSTRHPLGNALSGWMHVFLYALASGPGPCHTQTVAYVRMRRMQTRMWYFK